jgi:tetratricopeptide (TPR) repeat protein
VGEWQSKDGKVMKKQRIVIGVFTLILFVFITGCLRTPWDYEKARVHLDLGIAYIESGQYNSALKELLEANKRTPSDPRIHYFLGITYYGKSLNDKAIEEFQTAVDLKSDYSEAYNYLGIICLNAGQWDNAIDFFSKALANIVYDTPALALYNMGWAYYKKGDYPMALSKYYEAVSREPNTILLPMIEKNMGLATFEQGRVDEAIQHFKNALKIIPEFMESQYWLGECYLKQKRIEEARAAFQVVVKTAPESKFGMIAQTKLNDLKKAK